MACSSSIGGVAGNNAHCEDQRAHGRRHREIMNNLGNRQRPAYKTASIGKLGSRVRQG